MVGWAAHVEFTSKDRLQFRDEVAEELAEEFSAAVSVLGDRNRLGLLFTVEADDLFDAVAHVQRTTYAVVGLLSLRAALTIRPVQVKIGTHSDMVVETFGSGNIPLVGYTDIAAMGGFSRQYARQLAARDDFPPQVATVSGSPAFYRTEVEDYLDKIGKLRVARTGIDWLLPKGNDETVKDKVATT